MNWKIFIKFLTYKYIDYNKYQLKNVLSNLNKKVLVLKYKNQNKKFILYNILKIKTFLGHKKLIRYFYQFYYKSKFIFCKKENDIYEKEQNKILIKENLFNIFLKKI